MKHLKLLVVIACSCLLVSCFDTVEEIEIKKDGSGTYQMNMDMSKAVDMMKSFLSETDLEKENLNTPIDTTINLNDVMDTAQNISSRQKELFKNGKAHVKMDMKNGILKMDMHCPFNNLDNLNELYSLIQKGEGGINDIFKSMPSDMSMEDNSDSDNSPNQLNSVYDVVVKNGVYTKTLNKERYDAFLKDEKVEQLKGMMGMMDDMSYTLVLKLPAAAKSVSNKLATLSSDNKTVTLKSNLFNVFDSPQLLELKVTY